MSAPEGGLAVLFGRRRLGKTRLLLEWSAKHKGLYTVGCRRGRLAWARSLVPI